MMDPPKTFDPQPEQMQSGEQKADFEIGTSKNIPCKSANPRKEKRKMRTP